MGTRPPDRIDHSSQEFLATLRVSQSIFTGRWGQRGADQQLEKPEEFPWCNPGGDCSHHHVSAIDDKPLKPLIYSPSSCAFFDPPHLPPPQEAYHNNSSTPPSWDSGGFLYTWVRFVRTLAGCYAALGPPGTFAHLAVRGSGTNALGRARGGGPVRPSGWPPCARGVPRLDERQGCPSVLARSVGRPWTGARRPALRGPAVRATPRMDRALYVRSRHPDLGGELRNPDGPDDLGESLLHGEAVVAGGQKEGAGKRAVAQPLREIEFPFFTASCRACPPARHSNTGARVECPDDSCTVVVRLYSFSILRGFPRPATRWPGRGARRLRRLRPGS